jgi:arginase
MAKKISQKVNTPIKNFVDKPILNVSIETKINVFGLASGIAGKIYGAELGVWDLYYSLPRISSKFYLKKIYHHNVVANKLNAVPILEQFFIDPFIDIEYFTIKNILASYNKYLFLTGDHFNAVAVWASLQNAIKEDIGLIWIDAHLDSHTTETSESNDLHGMPIATLMGKNKLEKFNLLIKHPLKPENICFIGTRDYEQEELDFLNSLGVKIFFMKDIKKNNITDIFKEAVDIVTKSTVRFGVSFDIDSLDPIYAPATGCFTPKGLDPEMLYNCLETLGKHPCFIGLEITEFNPLLDEKRKTFEVIKKLITNTFNIK